MISIAVAARCAPRWLRRRADPSPGDDEAPTSPGKEFFIPHKAFETFNNLVKSIRISIRPAKPQ